MPKSGELESTGRLIPANGLAVCLQVDCTAEKATCDKYGVSGFPTLKIFRNGVFAQDYDGPREAEGIVKYMRGQAGPSAKELKSYKELEKFIDTDETGVVGK